MVDFPQPTEETIEQSTDHPREKEGVSLCQTLQKSGVGPSTPFCFDVLAQLANIPTRITLYELLGLSKSIRDALR